MQSLVLVEVCLCTAAGHSQALTVQQLIQYFLSDTVQANLQSQGTSPMIATYVSLRAL